MTRILIPNKWQPMPHQLKAWNAFDNGYRNLLLLWHRRAGKDSTSLNITARESHKRKGNYWHMFPKYAQGRKAIWDGIDKQGRRIIDQVFPHELRKAVNNQEMKIELKCGSTWQIVGSDNPDSWVGSNPVGVVHSEYSIANPDAYDFCKPILNENGGWQILPYTPRGKNHGYRMYNAAMQSKSWLAQKLTVEDTNLIPRELIEEDRQMLILAGEEDADAIIEQEYWCSFNAAVGGSYYGKLMQWLEQQDGRITDACTYDSSLPVYTCWDLGIRDSTAVWFFQVKTTNMGFEVRWIDYYETNNVSLDDHIKNVLAKPYTYKAHYAPHDIEQREQTTGETRKEYAARFGIFFTTNKRRMKADTRNMVRRVLQNSYFNRDKTARGQDCLSQHSRAWDDKRRTFKDEAAHDWTSHGADSFGEGCVAVLDIVNSEDSFGYSGDFTPNIGIV